MRRSVIFCHTLPANERPEEGFTEREREETECCWLIDSQRPTGGEKSGEQEKGEKITVRGKRKGEWGGEERQQQSDFHIHTHRHTLTTLGSSPPTLRARFPGQISRLTQPSLSSPPPPELHQDEPVQEKVQEAAHQGGSLFLPFPHGNTHPR